MHLLKILFIVYLGIKDYISLYRLLRNNKAHCVMRRDMSQQAIERVRSAD